MWRKKVICLSLAALPVFFPHQAGAADKIAVKVLVPTFASPTGLGGNVSTILALRLWTTLRPRPAPNPRNLFFGLGQIEWSKVRIENSFEGSLKAAADTGSAMTLDGEVFEYGNGVLVTPNLVISKGVQLKNTRHAWVVELRGRKLELGLPNYVYQFSPLILSNDMVSKYSRPNEVRVCANKNKRCDGPVLGNPFRVIRKDGDFVNVRQPDGAAGWVFLPDLSEAQGEVIDFVAGLISYLRGDFEQSESYFGRVRDSNADTVVRHDCMLFAAISKARGGGGLADLRSAQKQNPYSTFAVQALIMGILAEVQALPSGPERDRRVREVRELIGPYRELFALQDRWADNVHLILRQFD